MTMNLGDEARAYVLLARTRKAEKMAFLLWASDIPYEQAETFKESQWGMLAKAAEVSKPSLETQRMVLDRLFLYESKGAVAA